MELGGVAEVYPILDVNNRRCQVRRTERMSALTCKGKFRLSPQDNLEYDATQNLQQLIRGLEVLIC